MQAITDIAGRKLVVAIATDHGGYNAKPELEKELITTDRLELKKLLEKEKQRQQMSQTA